MISRDLDRFLTDFNGIPWNLFKNCLTTSRSVPVLKRNLAISLQKMENLSACTISNEIVSKLIHKGSDSVIAMANLSSGFKSCNCDWLQRLLSSLRVPPGAVITVRFINFGWAKAVTAISLENENQPEVSCIQFFWDPSGHGRPRLRVKDVRGKSCIFLCSERWGESFWARTSARISARTSTGYPARNFTFRLLFCSWLSLIAPERIVDCIYSCCPW